MKILHINAGNENGGGRTILINLLQALDAADVDAQLLVLERGPVSDRAEKMGIHTTIMNQNSQFDLSVLKRLRKFITDNQIDVINTHGPRANFLMSLIHKKVPAKWVITVHSDPNIDFPNTIKGKLMTSLNVKSLKKADLVTLVSDSFKPVIEKLGVKSDKIRPMFNAMVFQDQAPVAQKQAQFTLLNVARLTGVKNFPLLFHALETIDFDYHVKIVGDGPDKDELKNLAEKLGIADKIDFLGFKNDPTSYYGQADVFVLTSDSEGFPMVLLEAANSGIPAITTDAGSSGKMVQPDNGWVVPIGDVDKLRAAIIDAHTKWENNQLLTLGQKFYQHCSQNFSSTNLAKAYVKAYESVLK